MPAFSFEKISAPLYGASTVDQPVLKQTIEPRSDSATDRDSKSEKRGIVINWLDRLVERRIEKVERDIERVAKTGSAETH